MYNLRNYFAKIPCRYHYVSFLPKRNSSYKKQTKKSQLEKTIDRDAYRDITMRRRIVPPLRPVRTSLLRLTDRDARRRCRRGVGRRLAPRRRLLVPRAQHQRLRGVQLAPRLLQRARQRAVVRAQRVPLHARVVDCDMRRRATNDKRQ